MIRERGLLLVPFVLAVVLGASLTGSALAAGRGGGDSGDSSMNPFTGDSYAYFHGGHNLGEQGTIFPDHAYRTPPGKAQEPKAVRKPASGPQADARVGRTPRYDLPQ